MLPPAFVDPSTSRDDNDPLAGQVLGPYRVVRLLGVGGMGRVYLAEDIATGGPIALKVLKEEIVRDRAARIRLLREARAASAGLHDCVAAVYAIHEVDDVVFIAMEYVEGRTLRAVLEVGPGPLEIREALRIASDVAHALCHTHAAGVVHRDLKPENLMLAPRGQVKILDFGLAKLAGPLLDDNLAEGATLGFATANGIILGTPSYMAPEQIHGKPTDGRTDIFSLGVVLYEMVAGVRPFRGVSTIEILVATLRDELSPASAHNHAVSPGLDALLTRCLARAPEDRFASAEALAAVLDSLLLAEVEVELRGAAAGEPHGYLGALIPPRALRGRDREESALLDAVQSAREGGAHLVLVHGEAGLGKSALLNSLRDPVERCGGRFAAGKFDRNARGAPLAPLAQALAAIVRQIIAAPDAKRWSIDLAEAAGLSRPILDDMLPDLGHLLGPGPQAPADGDAAEAMNRFHVAFQRLFRLFAARSPPLVLAFDDLHCADPAALHLIELILSDPAGSNVLVLASYRDSELGDAHPLRLTQNRLRRLGVAVYELALLPLQEEEVVQIVADALGCAVDEAAPLASRLNTHAVGNPAVLRHMLLGLHREGQLTFDSAAGRWCWDAGSPMTSLGNDTNVASFVATHLQRLPEGVQRVVAITSLAGRPIDLGTLSAIDRRDPLATTRDLREALREGMLVPSEAPPGSARATYQPLHDAIAQAAVAVLSVDQRAEIHLEFGRALLAQHVPDDDALFALVDHLDRGLSRMSDVSDRERLAHLHLEACRRAHGTTAYAAAVRHARAGLIALSAITCEPDELSRLRDALGSVSERSQILGPLWQRHLALTLKLSRGWINAEASRGEYDTAATLFDPLLQHVDDALERAELYHLKVRIDTRNWRLDDAIAAGLAGLHGLGVALRPQPEPADIEAEHLALTALLASSDLDALINAPIATEMRISAIADLMVALAASSVFADARLTYQLLMRLLRLFIDHGPTHHAAYALAGYGFYLAAARRECTRAFEFGQFALKMRERFTYSPLESRILHMIGSHITGWTQPFAAAAALLEQGYAIGVQMGDFTGASYNTVTMVLVLTARRHSLVAVRATAEQLAIEARTILEIFGSSIIRSVIRLCRCLDGDLVDPSDGSVRDWLADVFLRDLDRDASPLTLLYLHIYSICVLYHFGRHDPADLPRLPASAVDRLVALVTPMAVDYYFYNALHTCARYTSVIMVDPAERAVVESDIAELKKFAAGCPVNFEARACLAAAEYDRVCGRYTAAEAMFKLAIRAAKRHGEAGTEALACELAARHAESGGDDVIGAMYLRAAIEAYQRWGAHAVARRLLL